MIIDILVSLQSRIVMEGFSPVAQRNEELWAWRHTIIETFWSFSLALLFADAGFQEAFL